MPFSTVKTGSLLKKLADRESTTSDDILNSATKPDPQEPKVVGPLTSTEELLEALDLAIGSEGEDFECHEHGESESGSPHDETDGGGKSTAFVPSKRGRKSKKKLETGIDEPKFVELIKLLPPVPKKGSFEVNAVKKSLYFFS